MKLAWNAILSFLLLYLLDIVVAIQQNGNGVFGILIVDGRVAVLPLFGLVIGSVIFLVQLILFRLTHTRNLLKSNQISFPIPFIDDLGVYSISAAKIRAYVIVVCFVIPVIGLSKLWFDFNSADRRSWVNEKPFHEVSRYKPVSIFYLFDFNHHAYGSYYSTHLCEKGAKDMSKELKTAPCGVSYVPFWEPLIIILMNIWSIILIIKSVRNEFTNSKITT